MVVNHTVAILIGTRPDIIKMAPVYWALSKVPTLNTILIHSGQHDELADKALKSFNLTPNYVLNIPDEKKLKLGYLNSVLIEKITDLFDLCKPDLFLVHGDTVTAFSGACAAFQAQIPIGHIEAGLRTSRFERPFPEEGYRRAISKFTALHFAPTPKSASNLRAEGINQGVYVTGNTIVDSLYYILNKNTSFFNNKLPNKTILVTCHRRESYGEPLQKLCKSLNNIAKNAAIIWPVHPNPNIKKYVKANNYNMMLVEPMSYEHFTCVLNKVDLCITDSGGVMEEAAVLGTPTIVLRTETERPEVLDLDNVALVGYDFDKLISLANKWLHNPPKSTPTTIFGDGTAALEIAEIIEEYFMKKRGQLTSPYGEKQCINTT